MRASREYHVPRDFELHPCGERRGGGEHTAVPPGIVEATVGKVGEFGEDIENCFPDEIPDELDDLCQYIRRCWDGVSGARGIREWKRLEERSGRGAEAYEVLHHEWENKIQ